MSTRSRELHEIFPLVFDGRSAPTETKPLAGIEFLECSALLARFWRNRDRTYLFLPSFLIRCPLVRRSQSNGSARGFSIQFDKFFYAAGTALHELGQ